MADPTLVPLTQAATLAWVAARWPWSTAPEWRAIKTGEEAGEVLGALIKYREGRKTVDDVAQETAQLVICAMAFAESVGFDLDAAIAAEWALCGTRTWGTEMHAGDQAHE